MMRQRSVQSRFSGEFRYGLIVSTGMIIIGMGTAIDRGELDTIVKAAGSGGVYIATDPAKIGEIFLEAIASRKGA